MRLKVLGSGSSGNCYILENENEALIIEAGLPFMEVKKALDFNVMKIKAVITTHFHTDHSLYSLQYVQAGIPVFEPCRQPIKDSEMRFRKGNFDIRAFENRDKSGRWLHNNGDGSECPCVGFYITHPDMGSLVYATDTAFDQTLIGVHLITVFVGVTSGLPASFNYKLCSLFAIFFKELCSFTKRKAIDIICRWLSILLKFSVNRQSNSTDSC